MDTRGKVCNVRRKEDKDVRELTARYRDLLRQIAYPRRGTDEERMDIFDIAKLIQANFSLDDLTD